MELEDKLNQSDFVTARNALQKKLLYKYRSLSDDVQKQRVKDIIINHRVRLSKPSELNDPIEGKPIYKLGDITDSIYIKRFEKWAWNTQLKLEKTPKYDEFISWFRTLSQQEHQEKTQEINTENQEIIESKWRIFSLSATAKSELLWAHYGDSHKGIALVFDASKGEFGVAMKMAYLIKRKAIDIISQDIFEILFATILTKRKAWEYEEEYRCVAPEPWESPFPELKKQFMSFQPEQLIGIIFGARVDQKTKKEVMSWSNGRANALAFWEAKITESGDITQSKIKL